MAYYLDQTENFVLKNSLNKNIFEEIKGYTHALKQLKTECFDLEKLRNKKA
jgi:hypothetical protein